jgi:hypothetical protein
MNGSNLFSAIRGPVMLIVIGSLFALDHMGSVGFDRTWPLLIIVFGVLKLLERTGAPTQPPYPPPPFGGPTPPPSYPGSTPGATPPGGPTQ